MAQWLGHWVRTGLALDAFTFACFVAAVLVAVSILWHRTMAEPAARMVGIVMAAHVGSVAYAVEQQPVADRAAFVDAVAQQGIAIARGIPDFPQPSRSYASPVAGIARRAMLDALAPTVSIYDEPRATLWIALADGADGSLWIRSSQAVVQEWRSLAGLFAVLATLLAGVLGALGLRLHVRRAAAQDDSLNREAPAASLPAQSLATPAAAAAAAQSASIELERAWKQLADELQKGLAPEPARSWRLRLRTRLRQLFPPLLLQDVAAMLLVLGAVVGGTGWLAAQWVIKPRIAIGSEILTMHVQGLRALLEVLPAHERAGVLDNLPRVSLGQLTIDDPSRWVTDAQGPKPFVLKRSFEAVVRAVPQAQWRVSPGPDRQLWFTVPGRHADPEWVRASFPPVFGWAQPLSRLLLACAMAGAVWVVLQGRRRAGLLAAAAARLDGAAVPHDDAPGDWSSKARQVMASDARLRELIERRVQNQHDIARRLAKASQEARQALERFRSVVAVAPNPQESARHLHQLEVALDAHLPSAVGANAPIVDLNEALRWIAERSTPPLRLQTAAIPYVRMPRAVAMRLLRKFFDAMAGPDAELLEVSTRLDGAAVVVRALHPHAPGDPARGFTVGGALAEARDLCTAHGGSIRVVAQGPGWLGELHLPVARL